MVMFRDFQKIVSCKLCNYKYPHSLSSTDTGTSTRKGKNKGNKRDGEYALPRILSCGHTFCDKCLLSRSRHDDDDANKFAAIVICPLQSCQAKTVLPTTDTKDLPVNKYMMGCTVTASMLRNEQAYTMMTLLEQKPSDMLLPTVSAPTGTLSEKCDNCQQVAAEVKCEKCDGALLCNTCSTEIHSSRILSSHKLKSLASTAISSGLDLQITDSCPSTQRRRWSTTVWTVPVPCALIAASSAPIPVTH
ncbi:RNF17 [Bugula neritina]|uniref:RNF17 n=1 Tax=Bugula neritina TaxID=10212 RepID=A0A7J7K2Q7_BUGNE|nr:RNF17 [Bugula neritina]